MDLSLALMTGINIPIPSCHLILHQPTIEEISFIGETKYFLGAQCLCLNKSMYAKELSEYSNFAIFMMLMSDNTLKEKKESVKDVLTLLFPDYKVIFTPRTILFNREGENFIIDEDNFNDLQLVLKKVFCLGSAGQESFNPANAAAKKIADKLLKARQRIAEQKGMTQGSVFAQYLSILTVGLSSTSIHSLIKLTPYQLYDLVERYMLYVNWDIDMKSRLAGGKPDSKVDNWMKIIH